MSSSKSGRDNDYTSMDILQVLRLPTSKVCSDTEHNIGNNNDVSKKSIQNSLPNIQVQTPILTSKLIRRHSREQTYPTQLVQCKKLFYATATDIYDQKDIQTIWRQFQSSYGDVVMFDVFMDSLAKKIKNMREAIKIREESKIASKIQQKNSLKQKKLDKKIRAKNLYRHSSCNKAEQKKPRQRSMRKAEFDGQKIKKAMKKQMSYISKVIQHGQIFIHS